jgi:hypothetical protein
MVNLRDTGVDGGLRIAGNRHLSLDDLGNELLNQVPATVPGGCIAGKSTFLNDPIQQSLLGNGLCFGGYGHRDLFGVTGGITH